MRPIDIVDMEAHGIAKICAKEQIDFECYKFITDFADEDAMKDWEQNRQTEQKHQHSKIGFCALPVQYSTYNGGRYRPVVWLKNPNVQVNLEELGIAGTWNHDYIPSPARMAEGEWLSECIECERLERNNIVSSLNGKMNSGQMLLMAL